MVIFPEKLRPAAGEFAMRKWNRRELLKNSLLGLTALGTGAFSLRETLAPTPAYGELGEFGKFLLAQGEKPDEAPSNARKPTASDSMGPYYKEGAPYRGRLMPKDAPGTPMIIRGRVYGHDTRKTLEGAIIDVWQADDSGSYHGMDEKENYLLQGAYAHLPARPVSVRNRASGTLRLRLLGEAVTHSFLHPPSRLPAPGDATIFSGRPEIRRS